jgi:hypothetical protein
VLLETVDFGEVEVGTSADLKLWLQNDSYALLRKIKVECDDPTVKISYPSVLKSNEVTEVSLVWTPELDRRKGLHCNVTVEGVEVYE